jgi:serine/threonine-protein phosphatase 4 regulatory subunit 1
MFTALDTILKDKSDNLKLDAINHLSDFVKLFDTVTRENLIDVFLVLQKDPKKWRVRYSIAHQLHDLSKIYETETVFKYIFPISLKLCNDNVSEVRVEAARQMFFVIESLKSI